MFIETFPRLPLSLPLSASYSGGGVSARWEGEGGGGGAGLSYYCAQYIHQATQGESKRVTDKYITLSSTSQGTVRNKVGRLGETKGAAAAVRRICAPAGGGGRGDDDADGGAC